MAMDYSEPKSSSRKLVSARLISWIKPLSSSKSHEVVMIGGWPVVVIKGQFSAGQLVLYFEIDSFLPFNDKRYEYYHPSHTFAALHGQKGWVVQTVKVAGHVSQGMVFCIDDKFPEVFCILKDLEARRDGIYDIKEVHEEMMGMDLTDELKVKKWTTFCECNSIIF